MRKKLLVFTDLDGTLLDAESYSWELAKPALDALADADGLLIPCTSKTWAEVQPLQVQLGVPGPAVVENGAAIFASDEVVRPAAAALHPRGGWHLTLGPSRRQIMDALKEIERRSEIELRPFSRMTEEEAIALTGLPPAQLAAARERHHSEPFLAPGADLDALQSVAEDLGLHVTAGGRLLHLGGSFDKGDAVTYLTDAYQEAGHPCVSAGLGDSLNDRSMLRAVDWPFLIPKPDGAHDPAVLGATSRLCLVEAPGPGGWCDAMLTLIDWWTQRSGENA